MKIQKFTGEQTKYI